MDEDIIRFRDLYGRIGDSDPTWNAFLQVYSKLRLRCDLDEKVVDAVFGVIQESEHHTNINYINGELCIWVRSKGV